MCHPRSRACSTTHHTMWARKHARERLTGTRRRIHPGPDAGWGAPSAVSAGLAGAALRGPAGHEAAQIFLLDLPSGLRRQLTHRPRVAMLEIADPGIWLPTFLDGRTVGFYAGSTGGGTFRAFQVKTNGSPEKEVPPIT